MSKGTLNQVTLVGNLGADPESRTSPQGNVTTMLRVATTRTFKDQQGQYIDQTDWHRVVVYGRRATYINEHARKGSKLLVNGRLTTRKWQDRNGNDQYTTEVVGEDIQILDRRPDSGQSSQTQDRSLPPQGSQPSQQQTSSSDQQFDDDIPF